MDKDTLLEFVEITAILIELVGVLILVLATSKTRQSRDLVPGFFYSGTT